MKIIDKVRPSPKVAMYKVIDHILSFGTMTLSQD